MWSALAGASLVKQHDPVELRVEESAVAGRCAGPRAPVEEDDGLTTGVPGLLVVDGVDVGDPEAAGVEGLDLRVQILAREGVHLRSGVAGAGAGGGGAVVPLRPAVRAVKTAPCTWRGMIEEGDLGDGDKAGVVGMEVMAVTLGLGWGRWRRAR